MNKEDFCILNSLYDGSIGRTNCSYDIENNKACSNQAAMNRMILEGKISKESYSLTESGRKALEKYRVNNAVILAAGASTRFIPLSLEQPKGLFEVRGERLIERQIR